MPVRRTERSWRFNRLRHACVMSLKLSPNLFLASLWVVHRAPWGAAA